MAKKRKQQTETKEAVYDREINPLMAQIIAICKEHRIAMLASFSMPTPDDDGLACTTALLEKSHEPPPEMLQAYRIVRGHIGPTMINVRDRGGKIVSSTAVL